MKILIAGDSFAADWTAKYPSGKGWVNLLAEHHDVTNIAQAGIGEYKIYQQIKRIPDISEFDLVIISHTSPYRVHTRRHPIHHDDPLHQHADLSMADISYHTTRINKWFNIPLWSAYRFFRDHFDSEYQEEIYHLLRTQIHQRLQGVRCIVVNNFICPVDTLANLAQVIDLSDIQKQFPGLHNHLSELGNQKVFDILQTEILDH